MNEDFVKEEQLTNNTNIENNESVDDSDKKELETPTNDEELSSGKEDQPQPELPTDDPSDDKETAEEGTVPETEEVASSDDDEEVEEPEEKTTIAKKEEIAPETEEVASSDDDEEVEEPEEKTTIAKKEEIAPETEEVASSDDDDEEVEEPSKESTFIDTNIDMEVYEDALSKDPNEGDIVKGIIVKVNSEEVLVDIGFKSEGYIPISEFSKRPDGTPDINVSDEIDVYFMRKEDKNGLVVLSKEIATQKLVWENIENAYKQGTPIEGKITERIKGGLRVEIGSLYAFLPASQVDLYPVSNIKDYIGKSMEMKVIKLSKRRRNIVLSHRVLLEEELEKKKKKLLDSLVKGQLRKGVVKNITDFGAFVDLGGIDGLLHKTDMSWGRIGHPSEKVSKGDELEVKVLDLNRKKERISLGLKQKTEDPWLSIEEKYPENSVVKGRVVNITDYGAFVELEEGVEGLLHISEMSWSHRVAHPSKIVGTDDEIDVKILRINLKKRRISLGLKQLKANPWETLEERYPPGSKIRGKVRNLTDFGAFVEIEEGIDGLVHATDMTWAKRMVNPADIVHEDEEVDVRVMSVDAEKQRISLSLRHTKPDPWLKVPEKYKIGSKVKGKIVNVTDFGAFAKLEEGIEGLIHISELADHHVEKVEDVVSVDDILSLKVISIDQLERRIGLSLKANKPRQQTTDQPKRRERQRDRSTVSKYQKYLEKEPETALAAQLQEALMKKEKEG